MSLNIVILDGQLANPGDVSWSSIEVLGQVTNYPSTSSDQVIERSQDADVLILNKIRLNKDQFEQLPKLKLVCLLATGYDNVNIQDAKAHDVIVCNAVAYGVDSVAQHVFALILTATNYISAHNNSIQNGDWHDRQWSYTLSPLRGLAGKTLGIYGYGKIGKKVAELGRAFGMNILINTRSSKTFSDDTQQVSLEEVFAISDVISLHAPLSNKNEGIINKQLLHQMKDEAILINTARGGLINEDDLRDHLLANPKFIAALDVLSKEPPSKGHPLLGLNNCILTPHNAWANIDARKRLIEIVADNIRGFKEGSPTNVVQA